VACILIFGAEEGQRADLSFVGWAGALVLFAGLFDMLDGQLASVGGMSSSFGALFDSVLDRYSELVTFLGICYYLVAHHYFFSSLFTFVALIGSMMVIYTRARAEGLGIDCKDGLMQRPERVVTVGITAMACGIATHYIGDFKILIPSTHIQLVENISIFTVPIAIMAIMTNVTAFNRIINAKKTLEARDAITKTNKPVTLKAVVSVLVVTILLTAFHLPIKNIDNLKAIFEPQDTFPVPKPNAIQLFYLQRTSNMALIKRMLPIQNIKCTSYSI
jgi:phosphatidylglycerophosphate synthase